MYGYGYGYYGFDWTYVLLIIGMLLSLAASTRLKSTFSYYRKIRSASGLTGAETAERILRAAGITDVHVRAISGSLTDHYDPRTKTVSLSEDIYDKTSLAAVSDRTFFRNPPTGNGRNRSLFTCGSVSAGDTARRDQCIFQSFENASEYRNSWE